MRCRQIVHVITCSYAAHHSVNLLLARGYVQERQRLVASTVVVAQPYAVAPGAQYQAGYAQPVYGQPSKMP